MHLTDGDRVRHVFGRNVFGKPKELSNDGTVFIRNGKNQWLVHWDNEDGLEIVHADFLRKIDP